MSFSRIARGLGSSGKRVWATQGNGVTETNVNKLHTSGAGQRQSLICPRRPPGPLPASNSGVPGDTSLVLEPEVPLVDYVSRRRYAGGGGSWPQTRWQVGMKGFPVGKSGSSPDQLILEIYDQLCRQPPSGTPTAPTTESRDLLTFEEDGTAVAEERMYEIRSIPVLNPVQDLGAYKATSHAACVAREAAAAARRSACEAERAVETASEHVRQQMLALCRVAHARAAAAALEAARRARWASACAGTVADKCYRFALAGANMQVRRCTGNLRSDMGALQAAMDRVLQGVGEELIRDLIEARDELMATRREAAQLRVGAILDAKAAETQAANRRQEAEEAEIHKIEHEAAVSRIISEGASGALPSDLTTPERIPYRAYCPLGQSFAPEDSLLGAIECDVIQRSPTEIRAYLKSRYPEALDRYDEMPELQDVLYKAAALYLEGGFWCDTEVWKGRHLRDLRDVLPAGTDEVIVLDSSDDMSGIYPGFIMMSRHNPVAYQVLCTLLDKNNSPSTEERFMWRDAWEEIWERPVSVGCHELADVGRCHVHMLIPALARSRTSNIISTQRRHIMTVPTPRS